MPKLVDTAPLWVDVGRRRPKIGRARPQSGRVPAQVGRSWPTWDDAGPNLADPEEQFAEIDRDRPAVAHFGRRRARLRPNLAQFRQMSTASAEVRPDLIRMWPDSSSLTVSPDTGKVDVHPHRLRGLRSVFLATKRMVLLENV